MAERGGAAMRRRLRSWWCHEQQSIAAVVATVSHHSYPKVDTANDGQRAQKTVTSTGEEVEYVKHAPLRAQKTPPPGMRPGSLAEPGPQRSDHSLGNSSLGVPSLADASAEAGDGRTLRFLLMKTLAL